MNGFSLGLYHIHGVVQICLIVNSRLGGSEETDMIALLVVVLVHDEAYQIYPVYNWWGFLDFFDDARCIKVII